MMTIEEKAHAYDEALNKARKVYEGYKQQLDAIEDKKSNAALLLTGGITALECQFSELKESEDERIRKEIIESIKGDMVMRTSKDKELAIAWLEKQKPVAKVESFADEFNTEFQKQVANIIASVLNKEHEYSKGYIEWIAQSLLGYAKNEMKPTEWSEEDEKTIDESVEGLEKYAEHVQGGYSKHYILDLASRVESLRPSNDIVGHFPIT